MRYVCGKNPNKRVRNYKKARSIKKDFMKATLCATMTEIAEADRQDGTRMLEHFQQTMDLNQRAFFIRSGAHVSILIPSYAMQAAKSWFFLQLS